LEGIIPAIESAHALAILKKEKDNFKSDDVVVITVSGRGDKDMDAYVKYYESMNKDKK
jgi:tryptophan synthase beta subunit